MKSSLNLIYRVIWSDKNNAWVVTSELTKSKSKKSQKSVCFDSVGKPSALELFTGKLRSIRFLSGLAAVAGLTFSSLSTALPYGYEVIFGKMTTVTQGANLSIYQGSKKLIANWQSFDIAQGEKVSLFQPNGGAALFRILGNNATQIFGQLDATANLFLFNPNGIYFGKTANVNVGSIVATTLDIKNQDFLNGRYAFSGTGHYGNVTNDGTIHAGKEGYIVLLGESVTNNGTLVANNGSVALASANKAVLDFYGNGLLSVKLSGDALNAYVTNTGNIEADGGIVQMATSARSAAINTRGIVQAHNLVERDGVIRLEAGATGTVTVAGTLDASGADNHGGSVSILGDKVALLDGATVNATGATGGGQVLVGGNYQGKGPEHNASATYIAAGAKIDASATKNGNGGKVIVWGNDYMQSHGTIIARGGSISGNGGFVETSSHGEFAVTSAPNVGANHGLAGTWLIDPVDLTINNAASTAVTGATPFSPTGAGANISWATIDAGLATGNVVVTTVGTGTAGAGDITVSAAGVLNNGHNLTIDAAGKLDFNQELTRTAVGDVNLQAVNNVTLDGNINLVGNSGLNIKSTAGAVDVNVNIATSGGAVNIQAANAIDFNDILTTSSPAAGVGTTNVSGSVILVSSNGNITGRDITTTGNTNGSGGSVSIQAGGAVNVRDVNTSAGALNFNTDGRSAGNVSIAGFGTVTTGNITANGSNAAGANKNGGNSGEVNIASTAGINVGSISSVSGMGVNNGSSGDNRSVTLRTLVNPGNIVATGNIVTSGGNVSALAQAGGNITLNNVTTSTRTPTNLAITQVSGKVEAITNNGTITTGNIDTSGGSNSGGGAVSMQATGGGISTGTINTSAGAVLSNIDGRSAGNVTVVASEAVSVGNIAAKGTNGLGPAAQGGNSGEVTLRSVNNNVTFNAINSTSGTGTIAGALGRNVTVMAGQDVIMQGDITSSSNSNPTTVSAPAVLIVAGRDFNNASNSDIVFNPGATGSWLIYSTTQYYYDPVLNTYTPGTVRGTTLDAKYGFKEYGTTYTPGAVPTGTAQGFKNGFIYSAPQTIVRSLQGQTIKPFDGSPAVTNLGTLQGVISNNVSVNGDQLVAPLTLSNLQYNNSLVGVGKPVDGNVDISAGTVTSAGITTSTYAVDSMGRPVFGYQSVTAPSTATGTIFIGAAPRDSAGLGTLLSNLNLFNGLTVQALNPAAGDDDPDYIPCPENSDRIGRNSVLNSGVKMPAEVIATCI